MMRFCRIVAVCILALGTMGVTPPRYSTAQAIEPSSRPSVQVAAADDACRPLLNTRNTNPSAQKAVLKSTDIAGSAAISLIFGVRTAIGPREGTTLHATYRAAGVDSERARATALYRHCLNQKTIESLASN